ncbi:MAG: phosphoglycerate kinase [Negativicutes bacterium]|nr:phosphoglycerate kinase [Negativicutes bacterium]
MKKTVRDFDVAGKKVLLRVDFNVPTDEQGEISNDARIRGALPTIQYLLEHHAAVILTSHFGRPQGKINEKYRLNKIAQRLEALLRMPVQYCQEFVGPLAKQAAADLKPGEVLLLENSRFHAGEELNEDALAQELASYADLFINDAFGAAHRAHATTVGVTKYLPAGAGLLMEKELEYLGMALEQPKRPLIAVIGGAKVSDKIAVLLNLLTKVDGLIIGGGMANTFLLAKGVEMGASLVEADKVEVAREIMAKAVEKNVALLLPQDLVVATVVSADAATRIVAPNAIADNEIALDIGPLTVAAFGQVLASAGTVIWNGPMGVFEIDQFSAGTFAVARAIAESSAISIIGGGDSAAAVEKAGFAAAMTHISTGGGASLEFLEGKTLPGVACLSDR